MSHCRIFVAFSGKYKTLIHKTENNNMKIAAYPLEIENYVGEIFEA